MRFRAYGKVGQKRENFSRPALSPILPFLRWGKELMTPSPSGGPRRTWFEWGKGEGRDGGMA